MASSRAGDGSYVASPSSQWRRHTRASFASAVEDQRKIASLEHEKMQAVVEVSGSKSLIGGEHVNLSIWY